MSDGRLLPAACAVAVLLVGCAISTRQPDLDFLERSGWLELRSDRFVLLGNVPEAELERLAERLALFVAVVERITTVRASGPPIRIYVVDGAARELLIPSPEIAGYIVPPRIDGYHSVVGASHNRAWAREVLLHEYTHYLLRRGRALRYPIWYDEGFADLLSTTGRRGDLVTVGSPSTVRMAALMGRKDIDLGAVFAPRTRQSAYALPAFYPLSWAVTHYLAINAERRERMNRFVELQASGMNWEEAYAQSFDIPVESLSRRVEAHVDKLAHAVTLVVVELDARDLAIDRHWRVQPVAAAEAAYRLGEFALVLPNDPADATPASLSQAFFARALALDPTHARARAGHAFASSLRDDFDTADTDIEQALREAADDPRVWILAGDCHRKRAVVAEAAGEAEAADAARQRARHAYSESRRLDPSRPSPWAGLGWSWVGQGEAERGIEALERARELGAWDAEVALDLGRLYREAGARERARELWNEVARVDEGNAAKVAEALIEETFGSEGEVGN